MHGIQGCGKSSAMACVYRAFSGKARWILLEPFVQQILKCRRDGRVELFSEETGESFFRTEEKWFRIVEESQLLCIDDIGLRSPTDAGYEIVFKLINAREDRPTFYTSNHGESDVARVYGRRISSRLLGGTVITCTGVDRREQRRVRVTA
jgi:predicted ATPase